MTDYITIAELWLSACGKNNRQQMLEDLGRMSDKELATEVFEAWKPHCSFGKDWRLRPFIEAFAKIRRHFDKHFPPVRLAKQALNRKTFWEEVGRLLAHALPPVDDGLQSFDCWFAIGEEYRLSGRSPASLVAAIIAAGIAALPQ